MFRRKEDNLFDTNDPIYGQADTGEASGSSSATATAASGSTSAASGAPASGSGSLSGLMSSRPVADTRPVTDSRPVSTQTSNTSFRPSSAPVSNELTRNRLPDTKPATTSPAAPASISIDKSAKAGRRVLTVGNDILLKGEIATCDRLVIEGKVDATLNDVHTVEISESGSFKGSAQIEDAEISGLFEGDLIVRNRLVIYATGKVRGKITYGEIEIERGGELTGEIKTVSAGSQQPSTRSSRSVKEAVAA